MGDKKGPREGTGEGTGGGIEEKPGNGRGKKRYIAALYMRLSRDDEKAAESASIGAQRGMLRAFAGERGYDIYDEYVDDGFSGTTFERPDFKRMIGDIETGRLNMVIVKDLSRLGRDYILTGQYTEDYFPGHGVRFIAVNDSYDSESPYTDMAPFQNVVNEMYARDISKKIRSAFKARMRAGEFVGAFAPYGYKRDPENRGRLAVDGETAPTVREIFCRASEGMTPGQIAGILNRRGVETPLEHRLKIRSAGEVGSGAAEREWTSSTVSKILKNVVYLGHMAQGKTTKVSFKSDKTVVNPPDGWIVVPDTHEPLVSREIFEAAALYSAGRACLPGGRFVNLFSGIAVCRDCGRNMSSVGTRKKGALSNLACGRYKLHGAKACTNHFIDYGALYRIVLASLREATGLSREERERVLSKAREEIRIKNGGSSRETEKKRLEKRLAGLDGLIAKLYEDHIQGLLSRERLGRLLARYEAESRDIEGRLRELRMRAAQEESKAWKDTDRRLRSLLETYLEMGELNPAILRRLIERIEIGQGVYTRTERGRVKRQTVVIHFRFAAGPEGTDAAGRPTDAETVAPEGTDAAGSHTAED